MAPAFPRMTTQARRERMCCAYSRTLQLLGGIFTLSKFTIRSRDKFAISARRGPTLTGPFFPSSPSQNHPEFLLVSLKTDDALRRYAGRLETPCVRAHARDPPGTRLDRSTCVDPPEEGFTISINFGHGSSEIVRNRGSSVNFIQIF